MNKKLALAKAALENIIESIDSFDIELVRTVFYRYREDPEKFDLSKQASTKPDSSFFFLIERIIELYRNEWSPGHKKKFRTLQTKFLKFDPDFNVSKISLGWWQSYVDYCFDELENEHNTIHIDLKTLRQLCEILKDEGYEFNKDIYKASMTYIEPKIEPLEWHEVKQIANVDLTFELHQKYEDSRYMWVLCAFIGQRWKDMERLNEKKFYLKQTERGKLWYYTNRAQKGKKVIEMLLLQEAVSWLEKRKFVIPKLSQQVINRDIKEIARIAKIKGDNVRHTVRKNDVVEEIEPRWKRVHIHTARHSFAIKMARRSQGRPYAEKFVSEMLGQASPTTTWKYMNFISSNKEKKFLEILGTQQTFSQ